MWEVIYSRKWSYNNEIFIPNVEKETINEKLKTKLQITHKLVYFKNKNLNKNFPQDMCKKDVSGCHGDNKQQNLLSSISSRLQNNNKNMDEIYNTRQKMDTQQFLYYINEKYTLFKENKNSRSMNLKKK